MADCEFRAHAKAPPQTVWELLADNVGMSKWSPIRSVTLERDGDPAPNGVGAIRAIRAVGPVLREEITAFEPNRRLAYTMLSGAPVTDYHAEVGLTEAGAGTDIVWKASFKPKLPGVGAVVSLTLSRLLKSLVAEAERRAGQPN